VAVSFFFFVLLAWKQVRNTGEVHISGGMGNTKSDSKDCLGTLAAQ